ncbi:Heme/copper-type cytochrome/quinol oxidase, subunit 3 [Paramagnetospirillum caucaseum]|uniref:Heme/copper-type cytochrome/quinol oxidase, subunit 3 n=1 Tax=Paramagnetospirillum caucaseum TaxID=1244869 RepID=M2YDR7_9PROT|nr:cytochrome c oxidase subunit 3 [Paramagnetospirillum caucaseum]EME71091.1 Heme/copper-type cytochrome/quinol oxidase, subunit 3 [Paramagnetospirillum caucaseum]
MSENGEGGWGALSELPGNPLMWVLILSELLVFGALLVGFAAVRLLHPQMVLAGQSALSIPLGGLNTLILVTSGWLAAHAVRLRSTGDIGGSRRRLAGAGALGLAFLVVKGFEYADKAAQGLGIETDTFWTLFYLTTGFHAAHVVMGIIILAIVGWKNTTENLETGAAFWHMVDLVWLILFPLVYLLR